MRWITELVSLSVRRPGVIMAVGLVSVLLAGCGDRKTLPTEPAGPAPDPAATFSRVQGEVFTASCALAGCHAGSAPQAGMDLSPGAAYGATVGVPSTERSDLNRIEPFAPDASYVVKKLRGDADIVGSPMPLTGAFTEAQFQLLVDWVRRGAADD